MSAALAVQIALRAQLIGNAAVTALVPADCIFDSVKNESFPRMIIFGEGQDVALDLTVDRKHFRVFSTLHVWVRETSFENVKAIAGAVRNATANIRPALEDGFCIDQRWGGARYLRDPDGLTQHGVLTVETLVELAS